MNDKLEYTKDLVLRASELIRTMMESEVEITEKSSASDLVTNVDKAIEIFLVEGITSQYSGQSFLTEEKTVDSIETDDMWIIDPIDGTSNFIFQRDHFSISVALYHKRQPVFGIVYEVMKYQMYWAEVGVGSFINDQKLMMLDQESVLSQVMLCGDVYRPDLFKLAPHELKPKFLTHRFLGSGALETSMVASGRFGAYVFPKIKVWDIAAAVIILACAGGTWQFGEYSNEVVFDDVSRLFIGARNEHIKSDLVSLLKENV